MRAVGRGGDRADLETSPYAIAPAGNEAVDGIGEKCGNEAKENGDGGPGKGQHAKGGKDGARADEDLGMRRERLPNDEDGAGSSRGIGGYGVSCD